METLEQLNYAYKVARRLADAVEEAELDFDESPEWLDDIASDIRYAVRDLSEKISNYGTRRTVIDGVTVAVSKHVEL